MRPATTSVVVGAPAAPQAPATSAANPNLTRCESAQRNQTTRGAGGKGSCAKWLREAYAGAILGDPSFRLRAHMSDPLSVDRQVNVARVGRLNITEHRPRIRLVLECASQGARVTSAVAQSFFFARGGGGGAHRPPTWSTEGPVAGAAPAGRGAAPCSSHPGPQKLATRPGVRPRAVAGCNPCMPFHLPLRRDASAHGAERAVENPYLPTSPGPSAPRIQAAKEGCGRPAGRPPFSVHPQTAPHGL